MTSAVPLILLAVTLPGLIWAQVNVPEPNNQLDLKSLQCSQYLELVDDEDPRADVHTVWAHGYHSALRGVDENSKPITFQTLVDFAKGLQKLCRESPKKLFIRAVKEVARAAAR